MRAVPAFCGLSRAFVRRDHRLDPCWVHAHAAGHLIDAQPRAPQPFGLLGEADLTTSVHGHPLFMGKAKAGTFRPGLVPYFSRRFADLATFFSGEPPDFFFLPPDPFLTVFLISFSIPAMR